MKELKPKKGECEKRWRNNKCTVHWQTHKDARDDVNHEIAKPTTHYFKTKVTDCGSDQTVLFRAIDEIPLSLGTEVFINFWMNLATSFNRRLL